MHKFRLLVILLLLFLCDSQSMTGRFGLGIILGEPTGITGKYWLSETRGIDGAVAWSLGGPGGDIYLHGDYIWHYTDPFNFGSDFLLLYHGVGPRFSTHMNDLLGVRVPFGVEILIKNTADAFLEIVPVVNLIDDTSFDLNAGLGFRYFF